MGKLSKKTLQRLLVMYLIGKFSDGVYSGFRFQKVLYFAEKDAPLRPFTFQRTEHGQYSKAARETLNDLTSMKYVEINNLMSQNSGGKWKLVDGQVFNNYSQILATVSQELKKQVDQAVKNYGYLSQGDLDRIAHSEPILSAVDMYGVILAENLPEHLQVELSEDECEDLELALNPSFIATMNNIVDVIENTEFDLDKVKDIGSIV